MTTKPHCPWCGRLNEGNAGDYHHRRDCRRRDVLLRIGELAQRGGTFFEMDKLRRELGDAEYTGD